MAYEVPVEMRDFAEKSVDQARKAFEGFMGAAQKAAGTAPFPLPGPVAEMGTKAMSFAETNVKAAFDLAQKLVHAKDMQEVLSLQSEYLRQQMAAIQEQARELGATVRPETAKR